MSNLINSRLHYRREYQPVKVGLWQGLEKLLDKIAADQYVS